MGYKFRLTNLITNPSFEVDSAWANVTYDTSHALYGSRCSRLDPNTTHVNTVNMPIPIVGHKYYGRHSIMTENGQESNPADCRFEWYGGDGYGLNFVFGWNRGAHQDWYTESSIVLVEAVNATAYNCRNFVVNAQCYTYCDGLMIIDLTDIFGSGEEPTKEWCDANIPFFEGTIELEFDSIDSRRPRIRFNGSLGSYSKLKELANESLNKVGQTYAWSSNVIEKSRLLASHGVELQQAMDMAYDHINRGCTAHNSGLCSANDSTVTSTGDNAFNTSHLATVFNTNFGNFGNFGDRSNFTSDRSTINSSILTVNRSTNNGVVHRSHLSVES